MATTETKWLLDTAILVDVLRGDKSARAWLDTLPEDACAVSVITAAELLAGYRNRSGQRTVERELELYETLWVSEEISQAALDFYTQYHLSPNVGFLDCLIAATATANGLRLATQNLKHFAPFPHLATERPY
ncbi:MAG: type II toxin-antitoxin system VapC family toxin [Chloroflexota bacterium]|nr:type II toxin-antitoxin system VapC family toxin [Chloroflexota bacterium]